MKNAQMAIQQEDLLEEEEVFNVKTNIKLSSNEKSCIVKNNKTTDRGYKERIQKVIKLYLKQNKY